MASNTQVVELLSLPVCEPNISDAWVMHGERGRSNCAWIAYNANTADDEDAVALVRMENARHLLANGPNDEAFHNHPFFNCGLSHYSIQELVNSPWTVEVLRMLHKDRIFVGAKGLRHFIFALKETTVDCIAASAELVGMFPTPVAAMRAACDEMQ